MNNSRETIQSLFLSQTGGRVGLRDSPWGDTLIKWVGQGYPADGAGAPMRASDHFNFDMVQVGRFEWRAKLEDEAIVEETDQWKIVRDGNGASFKWWKHKSGTPEHINFAMANRTVWEEEYKPHVVNSARRRASQQVITDIRTDFNNERNKGKWVDMGFRGLWENMRGAFGDIALYENMLLDPGWIRDYCRTYSDLYKDELQILLAEVGTPDGIWFFDDLGYKGTTFCAPELFGDLIFPFYRELIEDIHGRGIPVILHSCGFTEPVLDLIVDVGFDGINPMEVKAGNDPFRIAERYANDLVLIGGLDARILETHDRDHIRKEVSSLIIGMKKRGARLVFGSDHSLSTNIDYADFQLALEVYRECMEY